ncbi:MAG: BrnT family toxin [Gammaproteobacteria bacterium]
MLFVRCSRVTGKIWRLGETAAENRMQLNGLIWLRHVIDKLAVKHQVDTDEVEEALKNKPKFRFVGKGERRGEDVYMALGQTDAGRYLAVLFIYKKSKEALIVSARDMANQERKRYGKK